MTKVLVVEDDPINMRLVFEILQAKGFIADGAGNVKEAIKKIEKEAYDLVLMDIGLPGISGIEALKIIKNKQAFENVPVIALTSYAMVGDKERLLKEGFDDYIAKPLDVSDFMRLLEMYRK